MGEKSKCKLSAMEYKGVVQMCGGDKERRWIWQGGEYRW